MAPNATLTERIRSLRLWVNSRRLCNSFALNLRPSFSPTTVASRNLLLRLTSSTVSVTALPRMSGSSSTSYKALDPDRLVFEQAPTFEALVDPLLRAGFRDPRFFRRARTEWPTTVRARSQTSRDQQLRLYERWDDVRWCRQPSPNRRDIRLFRQAGTMYSKVHLRTSTKKAVRNAYTATVLCGQMDGVQGDIAAPRLKSTALSAITLQVVLLGWFTRTLLQQIIGCWMFVLLFRRPMLSILSQVYHEGSEYHGDEVFRLSHDCRQELLLLVVLVPCAMSNLRAEPSSRLFCTDASPFAAGICSCNVPVPASSELLRFADHRGFYTVLEPRLASYLDQFGRAR